MFSQNIFVIAVIHYILSDDFIKCHVFLIRSFTPTRLRYPQPCDGGDAVGM